MEFETTELISRCKAGDRQALHLLYQQYRPRLLNVCKYYAKEDGVAEDLLHDAFVVILTSLDKLEQTDKLYTQLNSTITTGSTNDNIQERQRLHYLGIPIRFDWQWYENTRFSLYTLTDPMLELPIHSIFGVSHALSWHLLRTQHTVFL